MEIFLLIVAAVVALVIIGKLKGDPDIGNLDVAGLKREIWATQNWINNYHSGGCPPTYQEKFQYKQSRLEQANERLNKLISNQTSKSGNIEKIKDEDTPPVVPPEMADDENYQDFLIVDSIRQLTDVAASQGMIKSQEEEAEYWRVFKDRIRNVHLKSESVTLEEVKSAINKELEPVFQRTANFVSNGTPERKALAQCILYWYHNCNYIKEANQNRQAAEQGNVVAQMNLGAMYLSGKGVPQDYVMAYMWQTIATEKSEDEQQKLTFTTLRDYVAKQMTAGQIAEAQELARKRIANNFMEC